MQAPMQSANSSLGSLSDPALSQPCRRQCTLSEAFPVAKKSRRSVATSQKLAWKDVESQQPSQQVTAVAIANANVESSVADAANAGDDCGSVCSVAMIDMSDDEPLGALYSRLQSKTLISLPPWKAGILQVDPKDLQVPAVLHCPTANEQGSGARQPRHLGETLGSTNPRLKFAPSLLMTTSAHTALCSDSAIFKSGLIESYENLETSFGSQASQPSDENRFDNGADQVPARWRQRAPSKGVSGIECSTPRKATRRSSGSMIGSDSSPVKRSKVRKHSSPLSTATARKETGIEAENHHPSEVRWEELGGFLTADLTAEDEPHDAVSS